MLVFYTDLILLRYILLKNKTSHLKQRRVLERQENAYDIIC